MRLWYVSRSVQVIAQWGFLMTWEDISPAFYNQELLRSEGYMGILITSRKCQANFGSVRKITVRIGQLKLWLTTLTSVAFRIRHTRSVRFTDSHVSFSTSASSTVTRQWAIFEHVVTGRFAWLRKARSELFRIITSFWNGRSCRIVDFNRSLLTKEI